MKSKKKNPCSTKCIFGKATGGVKSTAPPTDYPNSVTQIVITDAKKGFKEIKIRSPDKLISHLNINLFQSLKHLNILCTSILTSFYI